MYEACAVEQHVKPTNAFAGGTDGRGRRDVQGHGGDPFDPRQCVDIDVSGEHLGTGPGEGNGAGQANALPRCRDQYALVL